MNKIVPSKPVLVMLYGFPGSGKTYFSRQFCDHIQAAHLESDRIRFELFDDPKYTKQENFVVSRLMDFMASEFLAAGVSVVYDVNAMRASQRHSLRELAHRYKAGSLLVWFQIDPDTSFIRNIKRDRRTADDHYAVGYDVEPFKQVISYMQNPEMVEDFIVISGKHSFASQLSGVSRKLGELGVLKRSTASKKMVKPELTNIVPKSPITTDYSQTGLPQTAQMPGFPTAHTQYHAIGGEHDGFPPPEGARKPGGAHDPNNLGLPEAMPPRSPRRNINIVLR